MLLEKKSPNLVHFVSHGEGSDHSPVAKKPASLHFEKPVDGHMLANMLNNVDCVIVASCYSFELLRDMLSTLKQLGKTIGHLLLCEDLLTDEESGELSAGLYVALLCNKATFDVAIRCAAARLDKVIQTSERSVKLHYYRNGIEQTI